MPVTPLVPELRFTPIDAGGAGADVNDGSDGGASALNPLLGSCSWFVAVRNNGGVVQPCSYLAHAEPPWDALWAAAGFAEETFLVNSGGVSVSQILMCSTGVLGPLPFGTAELNDNLTKDGLTNVSRLLVYLA